MKSKLFAIIIISQLLIILFLVKNTIKKKGSNISVNKIKKDTIIAAPSAKLKYFFEPKPKTIEPDYDPDYKVFYHLNSDSLHEFKDYDIKKPEDVYRIITLGDSWTYGLHVNTEDGWTEKIEKILNEKTTCQNINSFEVINLAVPGYDTQYELERYIRRGAKYKPDLILWYLTDVYRIDEKVMPLINSYLSELKNSYEFNRITNSANVDLPSLAWVMAKKNIEKEMGINKLIEFQQKQLNQIYNYFNGKLVLVTGPTVSDENAKKLIKPFESKNNTYTYRSINIFSLPGNNFPKDGHPNQEGHNLIANDIYNYLMKNNIIPCN